MQKEQLSHPACLPHEAHAACWCLPNEQPRTYGTQKKRGCCAAAHNSVTPPPNLLPVIARTEPSAEAACWVSPLGQ